MSQKILVTGSAGLLGKHVVQQLADGGVEVHAIIRSDKQRFRDDVHFHEANLEADLSGVLASLPKGIDAIFHLAQAREFRDFPETALSLFDINLRSTAQLLDFGLRAGITNFVYASSGGVYSANQQQPIDELGHVQPPEKQGYYIATKHAGEALSLSYSQYFSVIALRYFFIFGPEQSRMMLVPRLFDSVKEGREVILVGPNGMALNPIHAYDAARATIAAGRIQETKIFNVAGPEVISLKAMCDLFGTYVGSEPVISSSSAVPSDLIANINLMSEELHKPTITISAALADIAG